MLWYVAAVLLGLIGAGVGLLILIEFLKDQDRDEGWNDVNTWLIGLMAVVSVPTLWSGLTGGEWAKALAITTAILMAFAFIVANLDVYRESKYLEQPNRRRHARTKHKLDLDSARKKVEDLEYKLKLEQEKNKQPPPSPPPQPVPFTIPEKMRTEHMHVVAGSGHGKSETFKAFVMADVLYGSRVIVIDSQNDLIDELATKLDNPLLIDPVHCPPPLNLFALNASGDIFEYIFSALDAEMTSKQSTTYRYLSRLVSNVGGNIQTMRRFLEEPDAWKEHEHLLSDTARSFFENEFRPAAKNKPNDTAQQILRRLYQVLENEHFERMLSADSCINIMQDRPVLISTSKRELRQEGASLLGRIFIAQVMQAVIGKKQKRTYLYLDEFQDYAEDTPVLFNLFEQARKYELGLIIAHQYLGQLPQQLQQSIAANTSIKFAGGVSAEDAKRLSAQMFTQPDFIANRRPGEFAVWVKGQPRQVYPVPLGYLDGVPTKHSLSAIRDKMRKEFAVPRPDGGTPKPAKEPESGPQNERGSGGQVPESGEW